MSALLGALALTTVFAAGCSEHAVLDHDKEGNTVMTPDPTGAEPTSPTPGPTIPTTGVPLPPSSPSTDEPVIMDIPHEGECVPKTCLDLGFNCGDASDGCKGVLHCGTCGEGELCGGESPNVCQKPPECVGATSCAELGWACGVAFDQCGNQFDCSKEGIACPPGQTCIGGAAMTDPTHCEAGIGGESGCALCDAIKDCSTQAQPTRLTGRVITPGRSDDNKPNQVGVPNTFVYILTNDDATQLPTLSTGIPEGGTSCDRCDGQDLGPLLVGAMTDALGNFTLEGNIPVGKQFLLVVKSGKFRRAVEMTLPDTAACTTTAIDPVQTRLPRDMADGLGVNIPRIAISTGDVDAMECVFEKMGVSDAEFNVPDDAAQNPERIHLYGTDGAEMMGGNPAESTLYNDIGIVQSYDMIVFDCQGGGYLNPPPAAAMDNIREYVNRGGRMFASHLSFEWICSNGDTAYSADDPIATGLSGAANFPKCGGLNQGGPDEGTGIVSIGRPGANPDKIENFADWLVNEQAAMAEADGGIAIDIIAPRDLAESVTPYPVSEEFVFSADDDSIQQFAFNTPLGSPADATCGRVAYSGFHVASTTAIAPFANTIFPEHCTGDLTAQEKVLLYMLFDLGACVGPPPEPPVCDPRMCSDIGAECGTISDGCGSAVDCGPCPPGEVCGLVEPNKCSACKPIGCEEAPVECGITGDGCGGTLECMCPEGLTCGVGGAGKCGKVGEAH